jgi:hypothetical protein
LYSFFHYLFPSHICHSSLPSSCLSPSCSVPPSFFVFLLLILLPSAFLCVSMPASRFIYTWNILTLEATPSRSLSTSCNQ